MNLKTSALIAVIGSACFSTIVAAAPCESLTVRLDPQRHDHERAARCRGAIRATRRPGQCASAGGAADSRALPREAGAEAVVRFATSTPSCGCRPRTGTASSWRSATAGSADRFRATATCRSRCACGYATAGNDTGHTRRRRPERDVRARPPGEDRRLRVPRDARDDGDVEAARSSEFYGQRAAVLVLQGLLDRRAQGVMAAQRYPGRLRRHHRRRARQPAHPDAHSRRRAQHRAGAAPGAARSPPAKAQMVNEARDERVRHAARKASSTTRARARSTSRSSLCAGADVEQLPDRAAAEDRRDVLRRREEQQGRADLLGPGARQSAAAAAASTTGAGRRLRHGAHLGASRTTNYDWQTFDLDRDMPIIDSEDRLRGRGRSGSEQVQGARRQAAALRGLGRHGHHAGEHRRLLRERRRTRWARSRTTSCASSWCPAWATAAAATAPTRSTRSARSRPGARRATMPAEITAFNPESGLTPTVLRVSAVREIQRHREYEGRGELDVRGAVVTAA